MLILLGLALFFTFAGGQIAIMLTDFVQGICCLVVFLIASLVLYYLVGWDTISTSLLAGSRPQASLLNPFDTSKIQRLQHGLFLRAVLPVGVQLEGLAGHPGLQRRRPHAARGPDVGHSRAMAFHRPADAHSRFRHLRSGGPEQPAVRRPHRRCQAGSERD